MNYFLVIGLLSLFANQSYSSDLQTLEELGKLEEYKDTAKELRCPTCTGLSVLESDADFSRQIKDLVEKQVLEGKSKEQILDFFVERYGPWILRSPPKTGFNLIAWLIPGTLLCLGPIILWVLVWRRKKVFSTFGVRSTESIVQEMQQSLESLRNRPG